MNRVQLNLKKFGKISVVRVSKHGINTCSRNKQVATIADVTSPQHYTQIPGPKPYPLVGTLPYFLPGGRFHKIAFDKFLKTLKQEYGELVRIKGSLRKKDTVVVFNADDMEKVYRTEGPFPYRPGFDSMVHHRDITKPDAFQSGHGIITAENEEWYNIRKEANALMLRPRVAKQYIKGIDEIAQEFIERIRNILDKDGFTPNDFNDELNKWSLETIAFVTFDTKFGILHKDLEDDAPPMQIMHSSNLFLKLSYELDVEPSIWRYVTTPKLKRMLNLLDGMKKHAFQYVEQAIQNSKNNPKGGQSVFDKLLSINKEIAALMIMDIIMAGVETPAATSITNMYFLAKNPDKQEKLRSEIKEQLPNKTDVLTEQKLSEMPYLRAVIKEAIRLQPASIANARIIGQDIVLQGYQVPKGTEVFLPHSLLSISEENFPEPDRFIPERWLRKRPNSAESCPIDISKKAHPFAYMPFGFGPRSCVGRRFADMELEILLINLLRNFKIEYLAENMSYVNKRFRTPGGPFNFRLTEI